MIFKSEFIQGALLSVESWLQGKHDLKVLNVNGAKKSVYKFEYSSCYDPAFYTEGNYVVFSLDGFDVVYRIVSSGPQ